MTKSLTESIRENLNKLREAGTVSGYDPLLHGPDNDEDEDGGYVYIEHITVRVVSWGDGDPIGEVVLQMSGEIPEEAFEDSDFREEAAGALQGLGLKNYGQVDFDDHVPVGEDVVTVYFHDMAVKEFIQKFGDRKQPLDGGDWAIEIKVS